tara:strand:- start:840 stop:1007 length:168 start_codon:yes stop_codon:yes gene_type:complete
MPSYGQKQKPAGKKLPCGCKPVGSRKMVSNNENIKTTLRIDNIPYQGNPVLLAQR